VSIDHGARLPAYIQLADIIEARIRAGELPVGRTIPSESSLQQEFGVSRGTVRKAVLVLRERRLVDTVPQRGTFVLPGDEWQ
jgi:DNA-binding GntR family transcriptional regulator